METPLPPGFEAAEVAPRAAPQLPPHLAAAAAKILAGQPLVKPLIPVSVAAPAPATARLPPLLAEMEARRRGAAAAATTTAPSAAAGRPAQPPFQPAPAPPTPPLPALQQVPPSSSHATAQHLLSLLKGSPQQPQPAAAAAPPAPSDALPTAAPAPARAPLFAPPIAAPPRGAPRHMPAATAATAPGPSAAVDAEPSKPDAPFTWSLPAALSWLEMEQPTVYEKIDKVGPAGAGRAAPSLLAPLRVQVQARAPLFWRGRACAGAGAVAGAGGRGSNTAGADAVRAAIHQARHTPRCPTTTPGRP
jgi:hypothetical protein